MKRFVPVLASVLLLLTPFCSDQPKLVPAQVDKAARERVAAGVYPALVIGIVDGDNSGVAVYGKLPDGKAPDADTVFEIGSITKTFTATLLADAVASNRVRLDTPVADLLPDFKVPSRNGRQITLFDIATQFSGLPRMPTNMEPADPLSPNADYDAERLKSFLAGYALPRDPGESYEYSNLAVGLLGYALGRSANTTYPDLVEDRILKPLGMSMTGVASTEPMRAHLAPPSSEQGVPVKNWDMTVSVFAGAGGLRSTAADMLCYLKANMGLTQTPLASAMKAAQEPWRDVREHTRIGLIWMTRSNPADGGPVIWHNGMTGGYASFIGFTEDRRHGVVILTNTNSNVDDLGFAALLPSIKPAPAHKAVDLPVAMLDQYAGSYKLTETLRFKVDRVGNLLRGQVTGKEPLLLFASADDEFFTRDGDFGVTFKRDTNSAVSGLIMHYKGADTTAPKLSDADLPDEPKAIPLDPAALADYVGRFQLRPGVFFDVTIAGSQLSVELTGQLALPVYARAKDKFFYKAVDAEIDFQRDSSGAVIGLVLHQGGQDLSAPRVAQ